MQPTIDPTPDATRWEPAGGESYFVEADPDRATATLTRVDAWDADAPVGPRTRGLGGGRVLAAPPGYGTPALPATAEAFVAGGDRLEGFPATWSQMFAGSPEVPGGGGSRDVSAYLRFAGVEPLPAGSRVLPGPGGSVEVFLPGGTLRTIYPAPEA